MSEPERLPLKTWAERSNGRTRIMVSIPGEPAFEIMSWETGKLPQQMK
jgi:hypothetical protein